MTNDVRPAIPASLGRSHSLGPFGYVAIVLILVLLVGAYVSARLTDLGYMRGPHGYLLPDPDSCMRWRLVRRALAGEGVRIGWVDDDNAPNGRINEWTSPMTILGVGAVRAVEIVTGVPRARALELAPLFLTPALGFLAMAALGLLGWRAGGWPLGLAWIVAWPVLMDVLSVTQPGNVDHHSLHQLLATVIYGLCLVPGRRPAWTGTAAGVAAAGLLWATASEGIVLLLPVGVITVITLSIAQERPAHAPPFWRAFWWSALLGSAAALVYEFWPQPWHTRLEVLGPWHVFALVVAVIDVELLCRRRLRAGPVAALVGVSTAVVMLLALALRGFHLGALHPIQDPRFAMMRRVITEFKPLLGGPIFLPALWGKYGLLPLAVPAAVVLLWRRRDVQMKLVPGAALLLTALTLWQARWASFTAPLVVMCAGLALLRWMPRRPWLVVALSALAALGPWLHAASVVNRARSAPRDPMAGPYRSWFALQAAAECVGDPQTRPVMLAPWDAGAFLAGSGRVRVVGSQYWSNAAGCVDTFEMFTTEDSVRFRQLLAEHQVQYILMPDENALPLFISECYYALHGQPIAPYRVSQTILWRRATEGARRQMPCEELGRWRPGWKVLRVD